MRGQKSKHKKTATEVVMEMEKENTKCCYLWNSLKNSLQVTSRDLYNTHETIIARATETMLKGIFNFCPYCGKKLK